MHSPWRLSGRAYASIFVAWTVLGLFFFTQGVVQRLALRDPTPWWHYLASWMTGVYLWAMLTPVVIGLGHTLPIQARNWGRRVSLHLAISVAMSVGQLAVHALVFKVFGLFPIFGQTFLSSFAFLMVIGFHQNIMTYATVMGIDRGLRYYHRLQEREREALRLELHATELRAQLVKAQLSALKMQLQPHFLFNTLNAIMVLVRQREARQAEEMLERLSNLLRCVLRDPDAQEVSLRRELDYLRLYLGIEQVRFRDRLRAEMDIDPDFLDAAVPQMVLQPIVENAVRHGIGQRSAAGQIRISAALVDDALEIKVQDDGPGLDSAGLSPKGIGLSNTRARLQQLYGETAALRIENGRSGGVVVTLRFPCRPAAIDETALTEFHALDRADRG